MSVGVCECARVCACVRIRAHVCVWLNTVELFLSLFYSSIFYCHECFIVIVTEFYM